MLTYDTEEVTYLLTAAAKSRGRKEMYCGSAVLEWLKETTPEAESDPPGSVMSYATLTGVSIILKDDYAPSEFRIIKHDSCTVSGSDVSHGMCLPIADGYLAL